eukprot:PhF_6_TR10573/c0_g1_i1/m.16847
MNDTVVHCSCRGLEYVLTTCGTQETHSASFPCISMLVNMVMEKQASSTRAAATDVSTAPKPTPEINNDGDKTMTGTTSTTTETSKPIPETKTKKGIHSNSSSDEDNSSDSDKSSDEGDKTPKNRDKAQPPAKSGGKYIPLRTTTNKQKQQSDAPPIFSVLDEPLVAQPPPTMAPAPLPNGPTSLFWDQWWDSSRCGTNVKIQLGTTAYGGKGEGVRLEEALSNPGSVSVIFRQTDAETNQVVPMGNTLGGNHYFGVVAESFVEMNGLTPATLRESPTAWVVQDISNENDSATTMASWGPAQLNAKGCVFGCGETVTLHREGKLLWYQRDAQPRVLLYNTVPPDQPVYPFVYLNNERTSVTLVPPLLPPKEGEVKKRFVNVVESVKVSITKLPGGPSAFPLLFTAMRMLPRPNTPPPL